MRAAIIGAGKVATEHIKAYQTNDVEIAAIMSRTKGGARQKAEECGIAVPIYDSVDEMFQHETCDLVSITSPPEHHAEHIIKAAECGKHMIIEKPAALSVEEGDAITFALLKHKQVKTRVSFVLRWNDLVINIKKELPRLGKIFYIECDYWHGSSHAKTHRVGREYGSREKRLGALLGGGCHAVDMAQFLLGSLIIRVQALTPRGEKEFQRTTVALVEFENGVIGKISATDQCFTPYQFNIRVMGERGTINLNRLYAQSLPFDAWRLLTGAPPASGVVTHHPFTAMIQDFIRCIEADRNPSCDFFETFWAHFVCFAAEESARREGTPIRLGPYGS